MHEQALHFCAKFQNINKGHALDLGGRYVNGSVHHLWPYMQWTCVDKIPLDLTFDPINAGVHDGEYYVLHDAATWTPDKEYDLVICTEVFEHTPDWRDICGTAFNALKSDGTFLVTCAGPERPAHSAIDGAKLRRGEHYWNIKPDLLGLYLKSIDFQRVMISYDPHACDVYAHAWKS